MESRRRADQKSAAAAAQANYRRRGAIGAGLYSRDKNGI